MLFFKFSAWLRLLDAIQRKKKEQTAPPPPPKPTADTYYTMQEILFQSKMSVTVSGALQMHSLVEQKPVIYSVVGVTELPAWGKTQVGIDANETVCLFLITRQPAR